MAGAPDDLSGTVLSIGARAAVLHAVAFLLDAGALALYSGPRPPSPETEPPREARLLALLRLGTPAFRATGDGLIEAVGIEPERNVRATGTATWFRALDSGGVAILDGTVGEEGDPDAGLILSDRRLQIGGSVLPGRVTLGFGDGNGS